MCNLRVLLIGNLLKYQGLQETMTGFWTFINCVFCVVKMLEISWLVMVSRFPLLTCYEWKNFSTIKSHLKLMFGTSAAQYERHRENFNIPKDTFESSAIAPIIDRINTPIKDINEYAQILRKWGSFHIADLKIVMKL